MEIVTGVVVVAATCDGGGDVIGGDGGHHLDYLLHLIFLFTGSNFLT